MTLAEWTVLGAALLYLLTVAPVKAIGHREFDNSDPRADKFYQSSIRKRALGAHLNGIETFPFFAFAVLLSEFRACPQRFVDTLAAAFLAIRAAYVACYLFNRPTLRTVLWNVGFFVNVALFTMPLWGQAVTNA